jgi:hypothetical protein
MFTYEAGVWVAFVLFAVFLVGVWYVVLNVLGSVMTPHVFISYRRKDRPVVAGLIYKRLCSEYGEGNVTFDVALEEGRDYRDDLTGWLGSSNVVLAVVGPNWDGRQENLRPRIFDNEDWVRLEMSHAIEAGKSVIVVQVKDLGDRDQDFPALPKYDNNQLKLWDVSEEESAGIVWLRRLRGKTAVQISLTATGKLEGMNNLISRIGVRWRDKGWLSLFAWRWAGCLVILALITVVAIVGSRVAQDAAGVRPLAESMKKATDDLADRADQTKKTLDNLDGVYINPLPLEQFIGQIRDDNVPTGDLKRHLHQYVCWHMSLLVAETTPDRTRRYWVKFIPLGKLPDGVSSFTIRALFDEDEFVQQVKDKVSGASMYVSGRVENVNPNEVRLEKCRVAAGRVTEPPRKHQ